MEEQEEKQEANLKQISQKYQYEVEQEKNLEDDMVEGEEQTKNEQQEEKWEGN